MEDMILRLLRIRTGFIEIVVKKRKKKKYESSYYYSFCSNTTNEEFPALLNVGKDNGYSLGLQTNHDFSYVPLNLKREMKTSANKYRSKMDTKL